MRLRLSHVAWPVILAAGTLVAIAGLRWREIAFRWRTLELAKQGVAAELPTEFLLAKLGTMDREVLEAYLRTAAGRERLLRSYLSYFERSRGKVPRYLRGAGEGGGNPTAILLFWTSMGRIINAYGATAREWTGEDPATEGDPDVYRVDRIRKNGLWTTPAGSDPWKRLQRLSCDLDPVPDTRLLQVLQDLLLDIGYDRYPLPDHPGAKFSIVSIPGVEKPGARVFRDFPRGAHACLIESDPHRLDPSP